MSAEPAQHVDALNALRGIDAPNGEIQHVKALSEHIGSLYQNEEYSDVALVVEGERIPGHKIVLASRSEYFRALLYGGMRESQQSEIELKGTTLIAFRTLLKYIYTGHMALMNVKEEVILDVLGLAHQYGFVDLEMAISDYLKAILQVRNVCMIYDIANLYMLGSLANVCSMYMDQNADQVLNHFSFLSLSATSLRDIISRDSFCAEEIDIFHAVLRWSKHNPDAMTPELLEAIRLPLMSLDDILNVVWPTNLIHSEPLLMAIKTKTQSRDIDLKYRGSLLPEENMALLKYNAEVLKGEMKSALLDGDTLNYDMERGYTRHTIDDTHDPGIVVQLGLRCIVNHIKLLLWDRDTRSYSYYIEVSVNNADWVRVVDHTTYNCRSWQYLYFEPRVVRYIRIIGTNNTVNKVFHVASFETMYTNTPFELENGLIVPDRNVATTAMNACVIEGVSRSRNALLNGDTKHYDWDSGYTCHQLGSGAIVVQLNQPYMIDSMKLLLWDCDDRSYSYYIEVSVNGKDWDMVVNKTRETCKSWQVLTFERRPVVYVRVVGTHNTANEVFHCVHFECPTQINEAPAIEPVYQEEQSQDASDDAADAASAKSNREDASDDVQ